MMELRLRPLGLAILPFAAAVLLGCVNNTALDDLRETKPLGSAFNKELFKDYSRVAHSFGSVGAAAGVAFDGNASIELTRMDSNIGALANSYAEKALIAARGTLVEPESGVDIETHKMRDRLIRALERGKEAFPADAARAQVQFDCWLMNNTVPAMRGAAKRCHGAAEVAIKKLEDEAKPAPAPAPTPAPSDNSDKPAINP
ncbi:MAG: hypothetical protein JO261_06550 [Alphaproteobacteria bacterium]|nr:hypothetical protein [Alphaproteobacteria bacterium]MBV9693344.1 hypothetical protein [Alphaproteobacteria bacterium]